MPLRKSCTLAIGDRFVWQLLFIYWTIVITVMMSDRFVWQLLFIYWTIVITLRTYAVPLHLMYKLVIVPDATTIISAVA